MKLKKRVGCKRPAFCDITYYMKKILKGVFCVLVVLSPLIILSPFFLQGFGIMNLFKVWGVTYNNLDISIKNILYIIMITLSILDILSLFIWIKFAIGRDVKNSSRLKKIFFWILFVLFFVFVDWGLVWLLTQTFCGNCGSTSPLPVIPTLN